MQVSKNGKKKFKYWWYVWGYYWQVLLIYSKKELRKEGNLHKPWIFCLSFWVYIFNYKADKNEGREIWRRKIRFFGGRCIKVWNTHISNRVVKKTVGILKKVHNWRCRLYSRSYILTNLLTWTLYTCTTPLAFGFHNLKIPGFYILKLWIPKSFPLLSFAVYHLTLENLQNLSNT